MKKITQTLVLITCLFSINAFSQFKEIDLEGKWTDKELQVEYDFSKNAKAYFSQMGYGMSVSYKVDFSQSPFWIDFTLERAGREIKIPGLLRVIDKDTIWIEQFPPSSNHPVKFSKDFTSRARSIHILVREKS
ncbi:hypothetical protein [Polaribacter uvawellassae]|uniref:hypothetical protein n=1 Tax=Polaribacter uvawellassae TaxID=3133495 RepID=UPI00321BFEF0